MSTIEEKSDNVLTTLDNRTDFLLRCLDTLTRADAWLARYYDMRDKTIDKSK